MSSTLIGVAAVAPSNSTHHSTKRMEGVVVFVASWIMVLSAVPVEIVAGAAAPGAAPFVTAYVFAANFLPPYSVGRGFRRGLFVDWDVETGLIGNGESKTPLSVDVRGPDRTRAHVTDGATQIHVHLESGTFRLLTEDDVLGCVPVGAVHPSVLKPVGFVRDRAED